MVDLTINGIFMIDVMLNFRTAYQRECFSTPQPTLQPLNVGVFKALHPYWACHSSAACAGPEGGLERSRFKIAVRYLQFWFW